MGRRAGAGLHPAGAAAAGEPQPERHHRGAIPRSGGCCGTSGCTTRSSTGRSSPSTTPDGLGSSGCSDGCTSAAPPPSGGSAAAAPVVYAIFDLLYLDGHSLMDLPYRERRERLEALELGGPAWRVPAARPGEGRRLLEATQAQGLEGVVAKRLDSRYEAGRRSGAWLKIKNTRRQELVIGGWVPGEGRRERADRGAAHGLLRERRFPVRGAGRHRVHGADADELERRLDSLRRKDSPFTERAEAARGNHASSSPAWWRRSSFGSGRARA